MVVRAYTFNPVRRSIYFLHEWAVKILVVILTDISWLNFITTLWSLPLDDSVVTRVISIGNWSLRDESVVTNDERVVN